MIILELIFQYTTKSTKPGRALADNARLLAEIRAQVFN